MHVSRGNMGRPSDQRLPRGLGLMVLFGMLAVVASCGFDPKPKDGKLPCDEGCPTGYVCGTDNRCYRTGAPAADASADSRPGALDLASSDARGVDTAVTDDAPALGIDGGLDVRASTEDDAGRDGGAGESGGAVGDAADGGTVDAPVDAPADAPADTPADAPVDSVSLVCGAVGEPCCAGICADGNCCVSGVCLANGATCSTGGTCSNGACSSSASLLASTDGLGLGSALSGQSSPAASFTITNTGQQPSGSIVLASSNAEFAIQTGLAEDCVSGVTTLAANASCKVRVVFTPGGSGVRSALITFSASPGGSGSVKASGAGITPGSLSSSVSSLSFGTVTFGSSKTLSYVLTNSGQQSSGIISLASSSGEFAILNDAAGDCVSGVSTLGAGESCSVRIVYTPSAAASRAETVTFSATPGGSGSVSLTGVSVFPNCKLAGGGETTRLNMCTLAK